MGLWGNHVNRQPANEKPADDEGKPTAGDYEFFPRALEKIRR
jgi:hypothetical protein